MKKTTEKPPLIKRKNLSPLREELARSSFQEWIVASARARKLRRRGFNVVVPPPHVGRPQLLVISRLDRAL